MLRVTQKRALKYLLTTGVTPLLMYGFSTGPPPARTGAAVDGGLNCTACHRTFAPANSGKGHVTINTVPYTPGVKQAITVTIQDPDAQRWGFQMTARMASDESKEAGTFSVVAPLRLRCENGNDGPCNGGKEFIEHTQPATQVGQRDQGSFLVEWTPPATDVGEIVFYAAGNAANGDGTNQQDHIYTTSLVIRPPCSASVAGATGQAPAVAGVTDAASFRKSCSPGSLISIFGGPFVGSDDLFSTHNADLVSGRLPTAFGCVAVEIGGQRAPVFFVSRNQINVQVPTGTPPGPANVTVILNPDTANESRSSGGTAQVAALSPAFFLIDSKNIAAVDASKKNAIVGVQGATAAPGDIVSLFGTGFGPLTQALASGEFAGGPTSLAGQATITVDGVALAAADVLYAGISPAFPGLYQFNLRLPATVREGDVPVQIAIGGVSTQDGAVIAVHK